METKRAREIAASPSMVNVTYDERPIYIEEVHTQKDSASIHFLNQPGYTQEVSLKQIVEQDSAL